MTHPLVFANKLKSKPKKNNRCLERISGNMKHIIYKKRAITTLKHLAQERPDKYILIKRVLGRAIRNWKKQKLSKVRSLVISKIVRNLVMHRINCGLGKIWISMRKISKVCKWLNVDQN